jgi:hypothetical protein
LEGHAPTETQHYHGCPLDSGLASEKASNCLIGLSVTGCCLSGFR